MIACYAPTEDAGEEIKDEFYILKNWRKKLGPHVGMMYSWCWETSTQELERTIGLQEKKGSWAPKVLDALITAARGF